MFLLNSKYKKIGLVHVPLFCKKKIVLNNSYKKFHHLNRFPSSFLPLKVFLRSFQLQNMGQIA